MLAQKQQQPSVANDVFKFEVVFILTILESAKLGEGQLEQH